MPAQRKCGFLSRTASSQAFVEVHAVGRLVHPSGLTLETRLDKLDRQDFLGAITPRVLTTSPILQCILTSWYIGAHRKRQCSSDNGINAGCRYESSILYAYGWMIAHNTLSEAQLGEVVSCCPRTCRSIASRPEDNILSSNLSCRNGRCPVTFCIEPTHGPVAFAMGPPPRRTSPVSSILQPVFRA
ncbi:hypothetical protein BC628DRAFT_779709 [Trametes gibbosa]|nr:hypothetical protein BC628DRAFT_779709 [Trametes gibbosa]